MIWDAGSCGSDGKESPAMQERGIRSLGLEDALQKGMATHFSILPEEFHGQMSLRGYSPWDHKELDTAEQLTFYITSKQQFAARAELTMV